MAGRTTESLACASCGSGGDDPLVLFPAETLKVLAGTSASPALSSTGPSGELLASLGPQRRWTSTFAAGFSFSPRLFVVLAQPVVNNQRDERSRTVLADPALNARYTILMPRLAQPLVPQVQLVAGVRPAFAASAASSSDPALLDVGGSGHDEYRAGLDVWMGMLSPLKPGISAVVTESAPRDVGGSVTRPGRLFRLTASLTSMWAVPLPGLAGALPLKLATGLTTDRRQPMSQDGVEVPMSSQSFNGLFASGDFAAGDGNNIKMTWSRQGAFGVAKNSVVASTWALAWSRVVQ